MTWLEEVVKTLTELGGQARLSEIYYYIEKHAHRSLPTNWRASVRKNIEYHSSDSQAYQGKIDLFSSVEGISGGVWRLKDLEKTAGERRLEEKAEDDEETPAKRKRGEYLRIIRDSVMVRNLKKKYGHCCQVCGIRLGTDLAGYCEGHHLQPLGSKHQGPDIASNILIVCPNHHAEFDLGMIAVDPYTRMVVHKDPDNNFNGHYLRMLHEINGKYIGYHYDKIFNDLT